jgi:iron complex outermembrane receptor protein
MLKKLSLCFIQLLSLISLGFGQMTFLNGSISDDNGNPIVGATIIINEKSSTFSNEKGEFSYEIPTGEHEVQVFYLGYKSIKQKLKVHGDTAAIDLNISPLQVNVPEFTVEASYNKMQKMHSTQSTQIIGEKDLDKNRGTSLLHSIERMAGLNVLNVGTGVSKPIIRGMGQNRVSVINNGIKQEGQQWGNDHGLEIDQFSIGKVELLRGPSAIIYGAESMTGLLHLSPPDAPEINTIRSSVLLHGQSNNGMLASSFFVEANKKGIFLRAQMSLREYGDVSVPSDNFTYNSYVYNIPNSRLRNTAGNDQAFNLTAGIKKSWGESSVTFSNYNQQIGFFPGAHGRPSIASSIHDGDHRNIELPFQQIEHSKISSNTKWIVNKHFIELDIAAQHNKRQEFEKPHAANKDSLALDLGLKTYTANVRYHIHAGDKNKYILGVSAESKNNKIGGSEFLLPAFTSVQGGVFALNEKTLTNNGVLSTGLRLESGQINTQAHTEILSGENVNYERSKALNRTYNSLSGGIGYAKKQQNGATLKWNIGSGFRFPTAVELASNGLHHGAYRYEIGNADLQAERSVQLDFSYAKSNAEKAMFWEITPFANYFNNYIYISPSGYFAPNNLGGGQIHEYKQANAIHSGAELRHLYQMSSKLKSEIALDYVFAHNLESNRPLPLMPPASAFVELEYEIIRNKKMERLYTFAQSRLCASQNRVERNEWKTPAYAIFNVGVGTEIRIKKQVLQLNLSALNLLNTPYYAHLSRNRILNLHEPGRNFVVSIKMPLLSKSI